jgi:SpoVK/Ycf46/Vps4 family AAA+-type ATPase
VRLRGPVLEDWGFDRLNHLGSGLVALFAGPSGVGKTMAAQVLARDLGLRLFRVDLAGVVDKYIGETEKRLRSAFAFAERPGVLLLFDEADALFGTRTQARDSHDRYANLEINYLLQRIETFEGVAVLATNRKSELDPAFRRRLRRIIDFLPPGPVERLTLWKLCLPDLTPSQERLCEGIDHELLADKLSLNGADIKAAALGAAFLARAEGTPIRMAHVLAATQREMAKHGQALRLPLAEVKAR